jgi:hypothetical protein
VGKAVDDTNTCAHLHLEATAATSATNAQSCALSVSGLDLMHGCGLNRLVVGRDGVCAAVVNPPNKPRAACFDTKTQGQGAEQLASWIDTLPQGASVMIASCSRLSWAHNRAALATSLASLGALNPPTRIDDAYALVGVKGASAPLAEARTPCCTSSLDIQGNPTSVCHTCDQAVARASADTACGASVRASSSVLAATSYFGSWASPGYQAAMGAVTGTSAALTASSASTQPTSMAGVIAALQAEDAGSFDSACDTPLADGVSVRHGAMLATDGDPSSYWLSVGRSDAVITIDLLTPRLVTSVGFDWRHPADSLMLLYSDVATGNSWTLGGSVYQASSPPSSIAFASTGVLMQRIRVYMAGASNATWPVFGLNESTCKRTTGPLQ